MTDEEKLCEISAVLRKHNKPQGGLSHAQALYYIRKIANADDRPRINAHWNDNGLHHSYVCSNCKRETLYKFPTCPYCEAYMKGETK